MSNEENELGWKVSGNDECYFEIEDNKKKNKSPTREKWISWPFKPPAFALFYSLSIDFIVIDVIFFSLKEINSRVGFGAVCKWCQLKNWFFLLLCL